MKLAHVTGSPPNPSHFTILVRAIPKSTEEYLTDTIRNFFTNYHGSSYLSHQIISRTGKFQKFMVCIQPSLFLLSCKYQYIMLEYYIKIYLEFICLDVMEHFMLNNDLYVFDFWWMFHVICSFLEHWFYALWWLICICFQLNMLNYHVSCNFMLNNEYIFCFMVSF